MSASNRENKSFQDLVRQFFRLAKTNPAALRNRNDITLTEDIIRDISPGTALPQRTKAICDLTEKLVKHKFEEQDVARLYTCIEDLLADLQNRENRHLAYSFLSCVCRSQSERLDILRPRFFKLLQNPLHATEDIKQRFELLQALTNNGKNINNFEEEVGPFLLQWLTEDTRAGQTVDFLKLLVNVIKFNSAYIDEDIITGFVAQVCTLCCNSANQEDMVLECLKVLDTIVCYSILPNESLATFTAVLCRTVNHEAYCKDSWKVMRNLLGTHLGHAAMLTMCRVLQEPALQREPGLLRGAVFHVNMGLWGRHRVKYLQCSPIAVLPSFLQALQCNHPLVIYEVMLSIQIIINKSGAELEDPTWDCILDLLEVIIQYIETSAKSNPNSQITIHLHETFTSVEQLMDQGSYKGSIDRMYELIDRCSEMRPEVSVLSLINYLASSIMPTRHLWLSNLNVLLERYFKHETRTKIRIKVLDILKNVINLNRATYEDELMERIVVVHLQNISSDPDVIVREAVANLLTTFCLDCESKRCLELLDIVEKIIKRPFEKYGVGSVSAPDTELVDVKAAIVGLVNLFIIKLYQLPSTHAIRVYEMMVNHLRMHYSKPHVFKNFPVVRMKIFETFLNIRANSSYHIGYPDNSGVIVITNRSGYRYSPYICIDNSRTVSNTGVTNSPPPGSPAYILNQQNQQNMLQQHMSGVSNNCITQVSLKRGFKCFIICLTQEKDWAVLHLILQELPKVLQNKSLILSPDGNNDVDLLATALYDMVADKSLGLPETLRNTTKLTKHDFHSHVLPVLGCLASYHMFLESKIQKKIILALVKFGLQSRCSRQCITALTTCTLEMRDVMVKLLPDVLLDLSKISATVHISTQILEFLSTLTRLPDIFSSFVVDQYMAVFAISLPYTNPFKYNHYTVSLAHHVIAVWFLECRLPFRRDFVQFITKGLKTNIIVPFEEGGQLFKTELVILNEDSSNRKRSSSLTEQGSRGRRERQPAPPTTRTAIDLRPPFDDKLNVYHNELTETCIDLMARYTYSPCSALPKRLPMADFLLAGGQTMTWLLGNMLITVTTSGCSSKALKNGLCDKCYSFCRTDSLDSSDGDSKKSDEAKLSKQNSTEILETEKVETTSDNVGQHLTNKLQELVTVDQSKGREKTLCPCWCQGWAEICIRRPTGDISWVMRIQNLLTSQNLSQELPLNELSTLYLPSLEAHCKEKSRKSSVDATEVETYEEKVVAMKSNSISGPINIPAAAIKQSSSRQNSNESADEDYDADFYDDNNSKSRNPVRRSNSSPEMSASWKNPFLTQEKIDKMNVFSANNDPVEITQKKVKSGYGKDMRVSCEAIPEEMFGMGTTPPSTESTHQLQSFHSYPGTSPSGEDKSIPTTSATVPTTPNVTQAIVKPIFPENRSIAGLVDKPPQSPTETSPRLHRTMSMDKKYLANKQIRALEKPKFGHSSENVSDLRDLPIRGRDRGHTISVMSHIRKPTKIRRSNSPRVKEVPKSGINPSFVFLQLYHSAIFGMNDKPLLVGQSEVVQRSLQLLDKIPPYEIYKVGVIYVGVGQCNNKVAILKNTYGSLRYVQFLHKLGTMIRLQDVDREAWIGGLEQNGNDGKFAYMWNDDVLHMMFHVATLMPNHEHDAQCNEKMKHIGNDFVTIVYNESGEDYDMKTLKSHFNFSIIIIEPLDFNTNRVTVKAREDLAEHIGHSEPKIISDQNLSILTRQLALHANLASLISSSLKSAQGNVYASNWLERLRHIKRLKTKILQEQSKCDDRSVPAAAAPDLDANAKRGISSRLYMEDFTEYT